MQNCGWALAINFVIFCRFMEVVMFYHNGKEAVLSLVVNGVLGLRIWGSYTACQHKTGEL